MEEWNNGENQQSGLPEQNTSQSTLESYEKQNNGKTKKKGFLALKIAAAVVAVLIVAVVVVFCNP